MFEITFESILDTKTHKPRNEISEIFCSLDLFCLTNYNFKELIEYEHGIFKEYQYVDYLTYHSKRLDFLFDIKNDLKTNNYNLDLLIQYIKNRKIKVGLYPGSFRPFHIGHLDILKKAIKQCETEREREGQSVRKMLTNTISDLEKKLEVVSKYREQANSYLKEKILKRLEEFGFNEKIDENRLAQEVVFQLEKSDINEHSKILFHRLIDCMLDFINEQITPSDIRIIFWFDC
jgi:cytidyltransferase-like protein